MKRIISVLLCAAVMVAALCGCGNKKSTSDTESTIKHSVDVAKLASEGRIPEVEFLLGDPVSGVKDILFKLSAGMTYDEYCTKMKASGFTPDGSEYSSYIITQNNSGHTIMSANYDEYNSVYCMYTTENEKDGISAIAITGDAYGYTGNTLMSYVKKTISEKPKQAEASSELGFLPKGADGATCLTYTFGVYKLEFYFSSYNTLAATVLYDTNKW